MALCSHRLFFSIFANHRQQQPSSSIMPGKVNPVLSESLVQSCHYVIGLCQTATRCGQDGRLQLNATLPLLASCLHQAIATLAKGANAFRDHCLEVDVELCQAYAENALGLATALNPEIGYDNAAKVAKLAHQRKISIKEAARELNLLDEETLNRILSPQKLAYPSGK